MKQMTFASLSYDAKKKPTRRERFLLDIEHRVVAWDACWPWLSRSIRNRVNQSGSRRH